MQNLCLRELVYRLGAYRFGAPQEA